MDIDIPQLFIDDRFWRQLPRAFRARLCRAVSKYKLMGAVGRTVQRMMWVLEAEHHFDLANELEAQAAAVVVRQLAKKYSFRLRNIEIEVLVRKDKEG